ncbi:hypothetical protein ACWEQ3_51345, partial [Streptomyces mirabilis]
ALSERLRAEFGTAQRHGLPGGATRRGHGQPPYSMSAPGPSGRVYDATIGLQRRPEIPMDAEGLGRALRAAADPSAFGRDSGVLGPDLFGLHTSPAAPPFLEGFDYRKLRPQGVAAFFRTISMTRQAPGYEQMAPERFSGGRVLTAEMGADQQWATPLHTGAQLNAVQLPLIRYAIWLGGPLKNSGATGQFRRIVESAAKALGDSVALVLLTDVPRQHFDHARTTAPDGPGVEDRLADVRDMLSWAERVGADLVHPDELFPRDNPMELRAQYATELAKQVGPGYAAASDILRLEVVNRFGGMYIDGDDEIRSGLVDEIKTKWPGPYGYLITTFTNGDYANDRIIAPAGHSFIRDYINRIRTKSAQRQADLYNGKEMMWAPLWFGHGYLQNQRTRRVSVILRTGPDLMREILTNDVISSMPRINSLDVGTAMSWLPGRGESKPIHLTRTEVVQRVVRVAATLIRELHNREGDLHLTLVAPAVERLPDPGAAWEAALGFIAQTPQLATLVRTVTMHKLNLHNERVTVELPEGARRLLAFDQMAVERTHEAGLAPGQPTWVLAEIVQPARLLAQREEPGPAVFPHEWLSKLGW